MVQLLTSWHLFFQFYVLAFFVNHIEKENIYLDCFSSMLLKISPNITVFRSKSTTVPRDDPFFFLFFYHLQHFGLDEQTEVTCEQGKEPVSSQRS